MTDQPMQAVTDALVAQSQAIASLTQELATEHQQWLDAIAAGDTAQAQAIADQVQANTNQLNDLANQLAQSNPSAPTPPTT